MTSRRMNSLFWQEIRNLTADEKFVALYCLTGRFTNRIGLFFLPIGLACVECDLDSETFSKALLSICQKLDWKWNQEQSLLYISTWWKFCPPDNPSMLKGALVDMGALPNCALLVEFSHNAAYLPIQYRKILEAAQTRVLDVSKLNITDVNHVELVVQETRVLDVSDTCATPVNKEEKKGRFDKKESNKEKINPSPKREEKAPLPPSASPNLNTKPHNISDVSVDEERCPDFYGCLKIFRKAAGDTLAISKWIPPTWNDLPGHLSMSQENDWNALLQSYSRDLELNREQINQRFKKLGEYMAARVHWRLKKSNAISLSAICDPRRGIFTELMDEALNWEGKIQTIHRPAWDFEKTHHFAEMDALISTPEYKRMLAEQFDRKPQRVETQ